MRKKVRKTAIDIIGDVPWGTHFCQFYQTKEDLIDILVPYFKAGLENNEFCMWITSEPLHVEDVKRALKEKVNNLDDHIKKGQIEILDYTQRYTKAGRFDSDEVLKGWVEKEKQALERGFDGLRLTGNTFWLEKRDWKDFTDYEAAVNSVIGQHHMLAVCTYSLDKCTASEIVDVVSNHQFALIKRQDKWEIIESAEYKKTIEALRQSEARYRTVVEDQTELIVRWLPGGVITFVNDAYCSYFGKSRQELIGHSFMPLIPVQDRENVKRHFDSLDRDNPVATHEHRVVASNGDIRWQQWTNRVLFDERGNLVEYQSVGRDITDRKQNEEALKVHDLRLQALLDLNKMVVASQQEILDFVREEVIKITQSRFAFIGFINEDESVQTTYAWSKEVMRQCVIAETPRQFPVAEAGLWGEAVRQRRPIIINDYAAPHPHKKGYPKGHVPIKRFLCIPVFDGERIVVVAAVANKKTDYDESDVRAFTSMMNDVWRLIQRKRSQDALHESEERYRAIFAQAADSIVLVDPENGALVESNDRAHETLGYTREEFQKLKIEDFEVIESAEKVEEHIQNIIRQGGDTFETKHRTKGGEIRDVLASSRVISIGGRDFVQGIWRDITDRKDMEAQQLFAGKILERLNQEGEHLDTIHDVLRLVKQFTGFKAVGIRLRQGDDFPYFAVKGFSVKFVEAENYLCARGENGKQIYDSQGNPVLECMCGNVLSGRTDPALPFFTEGGSFWTNSTTTLLTSTSEQERNGRTRNRCNKAGYESVALIPLLSSDQIVGLLQLNDTRRGQFTPEMIRFFEGIGASIGIALARTRAEEEAKDLAKFPSEDPFPVLRIAKDGTILYSNDAGSALLSKWERQVGESAPHDWCQLIGDVLDSNRNKIIEVKYRSRIVSFVVAPVANAGYVNIYGRDVTRRKQAYQALQKARDDLEEKVQQRTAELSEVVSALREEARERSLAQQELQQSEARLQDAQRIAHIGNWDWDIVDNQLWWSDEVYRIFGLRPQEFGATYEAFLSHVHPDDREFVKQSVNEALYEYKPYSIDHRIVRPDSTERIVHEQAEIIQNAYKSTIRMKGTVQDVTAQKQAEEDILDNQKQLRSLTAELLLSEERERRKIATDLHDSIGQILAFSDRELGALQKCSPQKLMESVEEIRHHIKQAVKQTRTLTFDLSPPSLYDLGFEAAIEELIEQFSKERKIECLFESRDQYKPLADHVKILLYRSIRELLMNVAKHSKAKLVRIASSRVNNDVLITVEDDGTGFDISRLESKVGNSKGFGLFSIRERLTHIGGKFDIQSGDGKGTRITLLVPLKIKKLKKREVGL